MPARLAALRNDKVEAERLQAFCLLDAGCATAQQNILILEAAGRRRRQDPEVRREDARADFGDGGELRFQVWRVRCLHRLGCTEAELAVIAGDCLERVALRVGRNGVRKRRHKQVDAEGTIGLGAHERRLLPHVVGLRVGEAERAERAGGGTGGDQVLGARASGHWRLDQRQAQAEAFAERGFDHAVSEKSSRPISQRRISEVPAPIS